MSYYIFLVLDSWGKIGSGILSGHAHFPGQYDECINITGTLNVTDGKSLKRKQEKITTNYCTAGMTIYELVSMNVRTYVIIGSTFIMKIGGGGGRGAV